MTRTLLIGGSGRSGTTILCRSMARHPELTDVPEWRFTTDPDGVVDFYTQCATGIQSPYHFDVRLKRLAGLLRGVDTRGPVDAVLGSARIRNLGIKFVGRSVAAAYARTDARNYSPNFGRHVGRLLSELESFRFEGHWVGMGFMERTQISFSDKNSEQIRAACQRFLNSVAEDVCGAQKARYHLEKNTWNILCWDRTHEILPDAKLVHIVRDPRDVVASYMKQPWMPSDAAQASAVLRSIMNTWDEVSSRVPKSSYLEVRLEDLTRSPVTEYQRICDFWEIDWSDRLLDTQLDASSFGRWRREFTPEQCEIVSAYVGKLIKQYNYE